MNLHFKRAAAAMLAAMSLLNAGAMPVSAADGEIKNIVVIGDGISAGTGLEKQADSYAAMVGRFYHAKVTNLAQEGCTTEDLLVTLDDPAVQKQLMQADMILFSAGMNDLLDPFTEQFEAYKIELGFENINDLYTAKRSAVDVSDDDLTNYSLVLADKLQENEKTCEANLITIGEKLSAYTDNAQITAVNTYNCLNTIEDFANLSMKRKNAYKSIMNPCTWVTDTANAVYATYADYGFTVVDAGTAFKGLAYQYTNLNTMDFHPNAAGHLYIAQTITGSDLGNLAPLPGDLTGDTSVNATDAAVLLIAAAQVGAGDANPLTAEESLAADVNGDGAYNASDATGILQYAAASGAGEDVDPWNYFTK